MAITTKKTPVIKLRDLEKRFGIGDAEIIALDKINLTIKKGEFVSIMGPSGCGKAILLLVGLDLFQFLLCIGFFCEVLPFASLGSGVGQAVAEVSVYDDLTDRRGGCSFCHAEKCYPDLPDRQHLYAVSCHLMQSVILFRIFRRAFVYTDSIVK